MSFCFNNKFPHLSILVYINIHKLSLLQGYDIPGAAADTREFFPGTEEGEVDGYQAEEAGRDGVEGSDFDFFGTQRQSSPDQTTYQSLEVQ